MRESGWKFTLVSNEPAFPSSGRGTTFEKPRFESVAGTRSRASSGAFPSRSLGTRPNSCDAIVSLGPVLGPQSGHLLEVALVPGSQRRFPGQGDTCNQQISTAAFLELLVSQQTVELFRGRTVNRHDTEHRELGSRIH